MRETSRDTAVDRLIELAREDRPPARDLTPAPAPVPAPRVEEPKPAAAPAAEPVSRELSLEDQKDPRPSMWRSLLQLRVLLPYVSRLLPLLDSGFAPAPDTRHFDQGVAEVQAGHREIAQQVQDQAAQLKRVEEQLVKLREAVERNAFDPEPIIDDIRALASTVRLLGSFTIALLVVAVALLGYKLFF